jgi:hypothetical protein
MAWMAKIVVGFMLVGAVLGACFIFGAQALHSTYPQPVDGLSPSPYALTWIIASAWGELRDAMAHPLSPLLLFALLSPPAFIGYVYGRIMRTRRLRATGHLGIRAAVGALVALIVIFALDVIVHYWRLRGCHLCPVDQDFPPARLIGFMIRFLREWGVIAVVGGAVCALLFPRQTWDEYVRRRGY